MKDLDVHIDITLEARVLPLKGCHTYERLLKPFMGLPSPSMYMTLNIGPAHERDMPKGEDVPDDAKAFKAHVYGRRVLDDTLVIAVFDLLTRAPEARVEITRGMDYRVGMPGVVKGNAALRTYRKMLERYLAEEKTFQLILQGQPLPVQQNQLKLVHAG